MDKHTHIPLGIIFESISRIYQDYPRFLVILTKLNFNLINHFPSILNFQRLIKSTVNFRSKIDFTRIGKIFGENLVIFPMANTHENFEIFQF